MVALKYVFILQKVKFELPVIMLAMFGVYPFPAFTLVVQMGIGIRGRFTCSFKVMTVSGTHESIA